MRPRLKRIIEIVKNAGMQGIYGVCNVCGSNIYYYTDRSIKCSGCNQLFGTFALQKLP